MIHAAALVLRPFGSSFVRYATGNEAVVCLTNDLTKSVEADDFRARFPDRFFPLGMAEQNLLGVAAGMAREGWLPFYPTFSVFATRRPFEQIALSVAFPRLRVRILGFLPGLMTPGGVTHQAIDDVALMRLIPGMTVIDLGDATEIETVWPAFDAVDGPVYCRMLRGEVARLFDTPFTLGQSRELQSGTEIVVLSSGATTQWVAPAVRALTEAGAEIGLRHVSTLKPFGDAALLDALAAARGVVTVENHLISGGLGTATAELIAEHQLGARLIRVGIRDSFTHGGSMAYLLEHYGLSSTHVIRAVEELLGRRVVTGAVFEREEATEVGALTPAVHEGL